MKTCKECGFEKPLGDFQKFYRNGGDVPSYMARCKPCRSTVRRGPKGETERRNSNERLKQKYATDATYRSLSKLRNQLYCHHLTMERYKALLESQADACAICREPRADEETAWHFDHDHGCCPGPYSSCGNCVRGLLCFGCNSALGQMKDSPGRLISAAAYLLSFTSVLDGATWPRMVDIAGPPIPRQYRAPGVIAVEPMGANP